MDPNDLLKLKLRAIKELRNVFILKNPFFDHLNRSFLTGGFQSTFRSWALTWFFFTGGPRYFWSWYSRF